MMFVHTLFLGLIETFILNPFELTIGNASVLLHNKIYPTKDVPDEEPTQEESWRMKGLRYTATIAKLAAAVFLLYKRAQIYNTEFYKIEFYNTGSNDFDSKIINVCGSFLENIAWAASFGTFMRGLSRQNLPGIILGATGLLKLGPFSFKPTNHPLNSIDVVQIPVMNYLNILIFWYNPVFLSNTSHAHKHE